MANRKSSFMLYNDYMEQFALLSDEDAGKVIKALFAHENGQELPELDGAALLMYSFICRDLDRNREKYEATCRRNRENGAKGGRPTAPESELGDSAETESEFQKPKITERFSGEPNETQNENRKPNAKNEKPKKPDTDTDKDKDKEKEEIRDKDICTERFNPSVPEPPPVISLILNDKSLYPVTGEQVAHWGELFPAVDVLAELRKMAAWLESNPGKRKTARGIQRFITNWLSRQQDRGGGRGGGLKEAAPPPGPPVPQERRPDHPVAFEPGKSWEDLVP